MRLTGWKKDGTLDSQTGNTKSEVEKARTNAGGFKQ